METVNAQALDILDIKSPEELTDAELLAAYAVGISDSEYNPDGFSLYMGLKLQTEINSRGITQED